MTIVVISLKQGSVCRSILVDELGELMKSFVKQGAAGSDIKKCSRLCCSCFYICFTTVGWKYVMSGGMGQAW